MKYYAGLDVSMKETSVCIMEESGKIIKETVILSENEALISFFAGLDIKPDLIGMEISNISSWLYAGLKACGYNVVCMETRQCAMALRAMYRNKTDRNDARGIAQLLRGNMYREVHVKSDESQHLRILLVNRKTLVRQRVNLDNEIRGVLKTYGKKIGVVSKHQLVNRARELINNMPGLLEIMEPMFEARDILEKQFRKLHYMVNKIASNDMVCLKFMGIPGVGPVTALTYKTAVDRPERFAKSANVAANLGLVPKKYASGEVDITGRINKGGDPLAREMLYEAAASMLTRNNKWCALKHWGLKIAKRSNMRKAKVAVARKLAVIMHRMWVDDSEFQFGN